MTAVNRKPTDFEMAVYDAVREVPRGKVTTYGRVAAKLGGGAARAVGSALARNPFAPEVPCHRVVRADGSLGGFNGETCGPELARKLELLRAEGVPIAADGKVERRAIKG
jgi:methylated-DNA-[protein]-cysteine S-methyltransferase